jgi:DNA-binding transcriptional MerR regulator
MNVALIVAILAISTTPVLAQDQPDATKLKADAENVVKIISGDKRKIETYCELADLDDQIDEARQEQDTEKAKELSQKIDELGSKLGPEFVALADAMKNIDPNSQDFQEIGSILDRLDEFCGD